MRMKRFDDTLHLAAMHENVEVLKQALRTHGHLIGRKAPAQKYGVVLCEALPIHIAVINGRKENVECLLQAEGGMSLINISDTNYNNIDRSSLGLALFDRREEIVVLLRSLGADTNFSLDRLEPDEIELLQRPISEKEVLAIRSRIYFESSLTSRLLF